LYISFERPDDEGNLEEKYIESIHAFGVCVFIGGNHKKCNIHTFIYSEFSK